jgi:LysR family transcriptional regulator of beta-lactamase
VGTVIATPVCSPELASRIQDPSDLLRETLIEMRAAGDNVWATVLRRHGLTAAQPVRTLSFESYFETLTAAERGLGVAFGLFPMTSDWLRQRRLAVPLSWRMEVPGGVYLVYRDDDPRQPLLRDVADWLRDQYAALEPLPTGRVLPDARHSKAG